MCDEDFTSDDQTTIESSEENKDSFHSRCSSSNPDLSINTRETIDSVLDGDNVSHTRPAFPPLALTHFSLSLPKSLQVGGPRRKIPLIAMWEQRILEVVEKN